MALRVSATGIFQNSQHTVRGILQFNPISNVGGRTPVSESLRNRLRISIHIPRVGDDLLGAGLTNYGGDISIHIPRVGDDRDKKSTAKIQTDFNPHPPCGG